jgi:alanine dehydrogenase
MEHEPRSAARNEASGDVSLTHVAGGRGPAAFTVSKGPIDIRFLSERDVAASVDLAELLDALEAGFGDLERGLVQVPHRAELTVPGAGFSLAMSAWRPGDLISVKVVNVFDANLDLSLPNHLAMITLFDNRTGETRCVMDGTYITGVRTAASAVLSARMFSRTTSRVATVVGAGVQAREHLRLLPLIRDLDHINVCSLFAEDAEQLAELTPLARPSASIESAVVESDIVCLATHSPHPVINAAWVQPGAHVSSVGYCPPDGELPRSLLDRGRLFVETLAAFEPTPVGCAELTDVDSSHATTLGAVSLGHCPGRRSDDEITIYKAMGIAMEDMVAANLAYRRAVIDGRGVTVTW